MAKTVTAVIAAAGSSQRMGFDKLAFDLGGHTVLAQSVLAFDACAAVSEIVLVAGQGTEAGAAATWVMSGD